MTTRLVILSGLLLCGSLASGKNELSFKETVVPVKVAPDQDSITASFPFTNTSGTPVTISKIHVSCDCTTAGAKDNKLTYAPGESGVIVVPSPASPARRAPTGGRAAAVRATTSSIISTKPIFMPSLGW